MGTVHLTQGHHGLFIRSNSGVDLSRRVLLDRVLLDRQICCYNGGELVPAYPETQVLVRAALQACQNLQGFGVALSYLVLDVRGNPHIVLPHRVWGEIYLKEPSNVVVGFSHDSRYDNYPFVGIYQWLELFSKDEAVTDELFTKMALDWSDPAKWLAFFEKKIEDATDRLLERANALQDDISALRRRAGEINTAWLHT